MLASTTHNAFPVIRGEESNNTLCGLIRRTQLRERLKSASVSSNNSSENVEFDLEKEVGVTTNRDLT